MHHGGWQSSNEQEGKEEDDDDDDEGRKNEKRGGEKEASALNRDVVVHRTWEAKPDRKRTNVIVKLTRDSIDFYG